MYENEKKGGAIKLERQMKQFREVLANCSLRGLKVLGATFTWSRGKEKNVIFEKLDRGLATKEWFELFPHSYEQHLGVTSLDHVPLLFNISNQKQV